MDTEQVAERLRLSADEDLVLTAWQYRLMQRDIAGEKGKHAAAKREVRDGFRRGAVDVISSRKPDEFGQEVVRGIATRIALAHAAEDAATAFDALEEAGPALSADITARSRSLLLLIDLYGFEPWTSGRWDNDVRKASLAEARDALPRLRSEDLEAVGTAYRDVTKKLVAKSRSWKKLAAFGAVGLGLGVLTGGLAAPAVGALYGTAVLGYSGAVATSAGLAALGGGSVAAGGFGMVGGAAFIAGASGAAVAGAASAGARAAGFTAGQVAADVIRLDVATRLVLLDVEGDDEAAKAVVVAMRQRMTTLGKNVADLARKADELRRQRDQLRAELVEERQKRMAAEGAVRRLRSDLAARAQALVSSDDNLAELDRQIKEVDRRHKATDMTLDFVRAAADDLDGAL